MRVSKKRALLRGASKKCPHCGLGDLFENRSRLHDLCSVCKIKFLRNNGDAWAFLLFFDRGLFVLPIVAGLFFGLHERAFWLFIGLAVALVAFFIYTTPNRYGFCVAIDYLTRIRFPDPSDFIPSNTSSSKE